MQTVHDERAARSDIDTRAGIAIAPPAVAIALVVVGCMLYANMVFFIKDPAAYRFFPPFRAGVNANINGDLGHEYFNIARSLAAGDGYASPFTDKTGPTAWMPPILPCFLAALWWLWGGNRPAVLVIVLLVQTVVLIATGVLTLAVARQTLRRVGPWTVAAIFVVALLVNFNDCFQANADRWLTLLAVDVVIAGFYWFRPLGSWQRALGWGFVGGLCALTSPVGGFAWATLCLAKGVRQRAWKPLTLTLLSAALTVTPWMIRNYLVLGRWVPVKSNLAYELYQSHCLQSDAVLQTRTLASHPYQKWGQERREYEALGESRYVDLKAEQFWKAVAADPVDFLDRVAGRFLAATLWDMPRNRSTTDGWLLWIHRLIHPMPFLALLGLVFANATNRLHAAEWTVIALYLLYLAPYIVASYYSRYAFPLLAAKVLLVAWAIDHLANLARRDQQVVEYSEA
jgi:hypothetical protein